MRKLNTENITVALGLFLIFGGLQGLAMGCALAMIVFYKKRFGSERKKRMIAFEIALFAYFLLSHLTFLITMPYSSLYLASI